MIQVFKYPAGCGCIPPRLPPILERGRELRLSMELFLLKR